nr:HD domain-containing phosphohydrolase [Bacillus sp. LL01]
MTKEEFKVIQQHPGLGEDISPSIQPAELMEKLIPGVRSHHERIYGKGYPDQLVDHQIPLYGKILAVADAYDAMTSDRPYRMGMTKEKALTILQDGKGTQWDAQFVDYFCEWLIDEHQVEVSSLFTHS